MRLKFKLISVLALVLFVVPSAFTQNDSAPFSKMGMGIKVSTMGYGLEVATPLSNLFALRLGVNLTEGIRTKEYDITIPDNENNGLRNSFGYVPKLGARLLRHLTHGNLLLDFYPVGSFHLTVGAFVGNSKLKISGRLFDWRNESRSDAVLLPGENWPDFDIAGQSIDLEGGKTDLSLYLGNTVKPYLGIGIGRVVPKNSRVSFKFELGVLYHGAGYTLKHNGTVIDLANSGLPEAVSIHNTIQDLTQYIRFWPMLNLQLSYRIF